jgi:hypothetical protein
VPPTPSASEARLSAIEWNASLAIARTDVSRGAFRAAAPRLNTLVAQAPDLVDAARATELRSLAYDALRAAAPADVTPLESPPNSPREPPRPAPKTSWYGWQTLIADGIAVAAIPFHPAAGAALYFTGGPAVHLAHGSGRRAGASLGIRAGVPVASGLAAGVLGALVGTAADCWGDACTVPVAVAFGTLGAGAGVIGAIIIDAALVAKEPVEPTARSSPVGSLRPSVAPRREGGFDIGVAATW